LHIRNHVDDDAGVVAQRGTQGFAPNPYLIFPLCQKLADQSAQGLNQRGKRNIPLKLIMLAGNKVAALAHQRLLHFVDQRGLANA